MIRRCGVLMAGAALLGATVGFGLPPAAAQATSALPHPLVGAYYYLWNPENMATGTLRAHLDPPQQPPAALVNSESPETAARDICNGPSGRHQLLRGRLVAVRSRLFRSRLRAGRRSHEGLSSPRPISTK